MKKLLKILLVVFFAVFGVMQFVARPAFENPPFDQSKQIFSVVNVPENIQLTLRTSCFDCHSNETKYPFYSKIAPSSWFLAEHIDEGRREMNFSTWGDTTINRQMRKLDEICDMVTSGEMPLKSYRIIHWDAKLSDEQKKSLCDWTNAERERLKAATAP